MVVTSALVSVFYNMVFAWSLLYTFASFTSELPWASCDNDFNNISELRRDWKLDMAILSLSNSITCGFFQIATHSNRIHSVAISQCIIMMVIVLLRTHSAKSITSMPTMRHIVYPTPLKSSEPSSPSSAFLRPKTSTGESKMRNILLAGNLDCRFSYYFFTYE